MIVLRPELAAVLHGLYGDVRAETLAGDASSRRFHRLFFRDGRTRIVMDYGAPFQGETDDVRVARLFERAALPVARVLEVLPEAGCLVLDDLGDLTFEGALSRAVGSTALPGRRELYRAAVTLAADIAGRGTEALRSSDRSAGPALDEERLLFEMRFFLEHFVKGFLGRAKPVRGLAEGLQSLAREAASHPRVLCHRDFHSRNLMVLPEGTLAMVDIQDARWGPDTYDIASLLRDAYVKISDAEMVEFLEYYRIQRTDPPERAEFEDRFHIVATQRMIKALGTFGYQVNVLGRERYRTAIPRTVDRLRQALPSSPSTSHLGESLREAGVL